jgi:hypothetical protein
VNVGFAKNLAAEAENAGACPGVFRFAFGRTDDGGAKADRR